MTPGKPTGRLSAAEAAAMAQRRMSRVAAKAEAAPWQPCHTGGPWMLQGVLMAFVAIIAIECY